MVDLTLPMARLPLPGETVVAQDLSRAPGGKGLNQAVVAARAGAEVFFQAAVGQDADAAFISDSLAEERFAGLTLLACEAPTDLSVIMVAADAENSIVSLCQAADAMVLADAVAFAAGLREGDWLVVQGNLSLEVTVGVCAAAGECGGRVLFNAAPLRWPVRDVLTQTDTLVVNRVEATLLSGVADGWKRMRIAMTLRRWCKRSTVRAPVTASAVRWSRRWRGASLSKARSSRLKMRRPCA
jgi:ribokinase